MKKKCAILLSIGLFISQVAIAQWQSSLGADIGVFAKDGNNVYVSGSIDLLGPFIARTTNYGVSWTSLGYIGASSFAFTPNSIMISYGNGIYKTTNDGVNWTRLTNLPATNADTVSTLLFNSVNRDTVYAGVFGNGTLYRTTNEGQTWDSTGKLLNVALLKDGVFYCTKDSGFYRSTDEGATWTKTQTIAQGTTIIKIIAGNSSVYACGWTQQGGTVVYRSTNSGLNWSLATQSQYFALYFAADGNLLFGLGGSVIVSANGGATWQDITSGLPLGFPSAIAAKDSIVFVSFYEYEGQVWKRSIAGLYAAVPKSPDRNASTFSLSQNYPNPFNPTTTISYSLSKPEVVTLKVYDILGKVGKEVATLVSERKAAGSYEARFDAGKLASGIYFYKLQAGNFTETKKMILVK
jgi:photosystem II stability/assembly factor-like uncharacterized protein